MMNNTSYTMMLVLAGWLAATPAMAEYDASPWRAELERQISLAEEHISNDREMPVAGFMQIAESATPQPPEAPRAPGYEDAEGRAFLGVNIALDTASPMPVDGILIVGVTPGGPAEEAGLRAGDLLLAIDGMPLAAGSPKAANKLLVSHLDMIDAGDEAVILYRRDGDEYTATLTTVPLSRDVLSAQFDVEEWIGEDGVVEIERIISQLEPFLANFKYTRPGVFGDMELTEISPDLGKYFGTREGLLVVKAPSSEAVPLEDGDVILEIDSRSPTDPAHAARILDSYEPGEELEFRVMREEKRQTLEMVIPADPAAVLPDEQNPDRN